MKGKVISNEVKRGINFNCDYSLRSRRRCAPGSLNLIGITT
jgi:hypothetical protein